MDNLEIYNKVRAVPTEALKEIKGGRLAGKSDINPVWRIKTLTEQFGVCGMGWYYTIDDKGIITGANDEQICMVEISLYIKVGENWSMPIKGTGGSAFIAKERGGLFTSDECFKMALTDAISVSCKALGIGADVYFEKDKTKYTPKENTTEEIYLCKGCGEAVKPHKKKDGTIITVEEIVANSKEQHEKVLCLSCLSKIKKQ